jgi:hypothetical protein
VTAGEFIRRKVQGLRPARSNQDPQPKCQATVIVDRPGRYRRAWEPDFSKVHPPPPETAGRNTVNPMTNKTFSRTSRRDDSGADLIVFLMMALVFAPIAALHAAMLWQGPPGLEQLAALMDQLFTLF